MTLVTLLKPSSGPLGESFADHAARRPGYAFCGQDIGRSYVNDMADRVIRASHVGRVERRWSSDYGNHIDLHAPTALARSWGFDTFYTRYAHLARIDPSDGQTISAGTVLGQMGDTGNAFGIHLHHEANANGRQIDPAPHYVTSDFAGDATLLTGRKTMYRAIAGGKQFLVGTRPAHILTPAHVEIVDRFLNSTGPATFSDDEWAVLVILISQANPLPGASEALTDVQLDALAVKVGAMDDAEHAAIITAIKAAPKAPTPAQVAAELAKRLAE